MVAIGNRSRDMIVVGNCNTMLKARERSGGTGHKAQYISTI